MSVTDGTHVGNKRAPMLETRVWWAASPPLELRSRMRCAGGWRSASCTDSGAGDVGDRRHTCWKQTCPHVGNTGLVGGFAAARAALKDALRRGLAERVLHG